MLFYTGRDPVGPYLLTVPARRVKVVRINDLIDPEPVVLDVDYAGLIEADVPVVVQFTRIDTGQGSKNYCGLMAHPLP